MQRPQVAAGLEVPMARSVVTPEDRQKRVEARLAVAQETLAAEVAALRSGEDWKRFLDFQARLHTYSPNNVLLIAAQHAQAFREGCVGSPDPGWVAGFQTWRALGRGVDRGQHGYMVLAPCHYERRVAVDPTGNVRPIGRHDSVGEGERLESRRVLAGFRVEYVFSVHQTSGAELPVPPMPVLLSGEAPAGLGAAVVGLIESHGFSVGSVAGAEVIGGANGVTSWDDRSVLVRADIDDAAVVKTLIHEAAHVLLHEAAPARLLPRSVIEVEAESVAYVVASVHGMATDGYSFPYVAVWAGEAGADAVKATQARVARAARVIIDVSPALHSEGGRPPGAAAVALGEQGRAVGLDLRMGESKAIEIDPVTL
jgi:hypothetical protein